MPGRNVHWPVGSVAGGLTAYFASFWMDDEEIRFLTIGGVIGGAFGGILPDILDPPRNMFHRAFGHSVRVGGGMMAYLIKGAPVIMERCYERALIARESENKLAERFWLILAGISLGFAAGYLSHLALDLFTPRSLPF